MPALGSNRLFLDMDVQAAQRTIEAIYKRHGFVVESWIDGRLKAHVLPAPELFGLPRPLQQERIERAWKEIDAVIHEVTT